jgi:hypothetical protein
MRRIHITQAYHLGLPPEIPPPAGPRPCLNEQGPKKLTYLLKTALLVLRIENITQRGIEELATST